MHEDIEKLLVLQERDRSIAHARQEVAGLEHQRTEVNGRSASAEEAKAAADKKSMELEVSKNALEVEVQGEQEKIRTYSKQQLETRPTIRNRLHHRSRLGMDLKPSQLEGGQCSQVSNTRVVLVLRCMSSRLLILVCNN